MHNVKNARIIAALTLSLALAACSSDPAAEEAPGKKNEGGSASGEVLGGSISDEMLPLDQLRSQSPAGRGSGSEVVDQAVSQTTQDETETQDVEAVETPQPRTAPAPVPTPAPTAPTQTAPAVAPPLQVAPPVDDAPDRGR